MEIVIVVSILILSTQILAVSFWKGYRQIPKVNEKTVKARYYDKDNNMRKHIRIALSIYAILLVIGVLFFTFTAIIGG